MQLVMHPEKFALLVMHVSYSGIFSYLCAGFVGGLGMAPGQILVNPLLFSKLSTEVRRILLGRISLTHRQCYLLAN